MSLRTQLTLLSALTVAAAVVIVSLVAYFATRDRLLTQVDQTLHALAVPVVSAEGLPSPDSGDHTAPAQDPYASTDTFFQVIDGAGTVVSAPANQKIRLPVEGEDLAVARGSHGAITRDVSVGGLHLRMLTSPGRGGRAVQVARSLADIDGSLNALRRVLLVVSGIGIALAALAGFFVAQRTLRPIARLTRAAEHVAATQDLAAPIDVKRKDEVGRLANSMNEMLAALRESRQQQHQLVTDASHELRTPLTSLRTNIEVLARSNDISGEERGGLLGDAIFELEELTKLVTELVELASDQRADRQAFEDIRLDELASAVVTRAARRSGLRIDLDATPTLVVGSYALLERAAGNLVDNAIKWSPPDASIQVTVGDGRFAVRDHGPGIAAADAPHVFDRFYRAEAARSKPGSGLGLAIVKQVIEAHGGRVWVEPAPAGGTIATFQLAAVALDLEPATRPGAAPS
ncbi:MAG: sensor histidine kinase [Dehalococcoidia bacterium]